MIVTTNPMIAMANGNVERLLFSAWMNSMAAILSTKASWECIEGIWVRSDGVADSAK